MSEETSATGATSENTTNSTVTNATNGSTVTPTTTPTAPTVDKNTKSTSAVNLTDTFIDTKPNVSNSPTHESPKTEIPAKFLNKDGTPNLDLLSKSYKDMEDWKAKHVRTEPKSIDDYKYEPKNPSIYNEEATKQFKEFAKDSLHLSTEQYATLQSWYEETVAKSIWTKDKTTEYFKKTWGDNFDTQNENVSIAVKNLFPTVDFFTAHPDLANHPGMINVLASLGSLMREDSSVQQGTATTGGTSQEAVKSLMREQMKPGISRSRYNEIESELNKYYSKNPLPMGKNVFMSE